MNKFHFSLDRVLDWRRTRCRMEEGTLEALYATVRDIEARQTEQDTQCTTAEEALLREPAVTGRQLAELDAFQRFSAIERYRLEHQRMKCVQRVTEQSLVVADHQRKVRLLEQLRERRLAAWNKDLGREIDRDADEAYLAKWRPVAPK